MGHTLREQPLTVNMSEGAAGAKNLARYFAEMAHVASMLPVGAIDVIVKEIVAAHARGSTIFIFGNGGSASTASHFACDLAKNSSVPSKPPIRALALTDAIPLMTAWANDDSYDRIFAEQLAIHARPGDLAIAISGSGNSGNILHAIDQAHASRLTTIALTGFAGGQVAGLVDHSVVVPASSIQVVEDAHSMICHGVSVAVRAVLTELNSNSGPMRPAIFVDRDGVINRRRLDHVKRWEEFEFLPGALGALAHLDNPAVPVVLVTNQAIIGRGLVPTSRVDEIHDRMQQQIRAAGGPHVQLYVCPHTPEVSCACRKPRAGLLLMASEELSIDLEASVFIGDSVTDVTAALAVGCQAIYVGEPSADIAVYRAMYAERLQCVADFAAAVHLVRKDAAWTPHPADREAPSPTARALGSARSAPNVRNRRCRSAVDPLSNGPWTGCRTSVSRTSS